MKKTSLPDYKSEALTEFQNNLNARERILRNSLNDTGALVLWSLIIACLIALDVVIYRDLYLSADHTPEAMVVLVILTAVILQCLPAIAGTLFDILTCRLKEIKHNKGGVFALTLIMFTALAMTIVYLYYLTETRLALYSYGGERYGNPISYPALLAPIGTSAVAFFVSWLLGPFPNLINKIVNKYTPVEIRNTKDAILKNQLNREELEAEQRNIEKEIRSIEDQLLTANFTALETHGTRLTTDTTQLVEEGVALMMRDEADQRKKIIESFMLSLDAFYGPLEQFFAEALQEVTKIIDGRGYPPMLEEEVALLVANDIIKEYNFELENGKKTSKTQTGWNSDKSKLNLKAALEAALR